MFPSRACAVFVALIVATAAISRAAVAVEQIEAPEDGNFAPVTFTSPIEPSSAFPGIVFVDLAHSPATVSAHAALVGQNIYGAGSPAQFGVSTVYADNANHFFQSQLRVKSAPGLGVAPQLFSTGVGVANLSFVASQGTAASDLDATRRLDTLAAKQSITVVAGAVAQTSGQFEGDNLFWSDRNALAVAGSDPSTPFTPAGGDLGRTHADLWSDGDSSFATGRISGYAVALIDRSRQLHQPTAARDYTIRGLLMTGADRAATGGTITPWTSDTPNHFDAISGAGKADYPASLSILNAGPAAASIINNNLIKSPKIAPHAEGYSVLTLAKKSLTAIVFQAKSIISNLAATLTWDVASTLNGSQINTSNKATPFADLSLDVRPLKKIPGKGMESGAPLKNIGLVSDAKDDNVEHLAFDGSLPVGIYAFILRGDDSLATPAAFSYLLDSTPDGASTDTPSISVPAAQSAPRTVSIPEPSLLFPTILLLTALTGSRRRGTGYQPVSSPNSRTWAGSPCYKNPT